MEILYANGRVKKICTSEKAAHKLFGGDDGLVKALHAKIQALDAAVSLRDILLQPSFHLHPLKNKGGGEQAQRLLCDRCEGAIKRLAHHPSATGR